MNNFLGTYNPDDPNFMARIGKGKILTHISLFSGCGGIDVGFGKAGIETRAMVEFVKAPCDTLRANWHWEELKKRKKSDGTPMWETKEDMKKNINWYHDIEPVVLERDIITLPTEELLKAANLQVGECSIISAGFPCQGFSTAGKRIIDDPRNVLYKQFVRIVNEAKPLFLVGENVPGLVSMAKGEIMKQICEDLAGCGYDITWDILNAADYGVPQHRRRVFIIGKRVDALILVGERPSFRLGAEKGKITYPKLFSDKLEKLNTQTLNRWFK